MKKGFTLQEALITIAIIGIVAAAVLPSVQKLFPDENKLKYMKAYNSLASNIPYIFENSEYYSPGVDPDSGNADCIGFTCMNHPGSSVLGFPDVATWGSYITNTRYGDLSTKFPRIFASKLNLLENISCTADNTNNSSDCYFQTINGVTWKIHTTYVDNPDDSDTFNMDVTLDVVPNAATLAGEYTVAKTIKELEDPEHFTFSVSSNGNISVTDLLGKEYLKDTNNMHNTKSVKARTHAQAKSN